MTITNRLGIHHLRHHPDDSRDFPHFAKLRPASYKPFEWMWSNKDYSQAVLKVLPTDCIILARDHPLSEQHGDMNRDPVGTGRRHADEWKQKIDQGRYHFPVNRTYFLGLNEPNAVSGNRAAIDDYTVAFLDRLREYGLKGAAFNFSTGHPRTKNGTNDPLDRKDYAFFEKSHQAILRGGHIAIQHIYGRAAQPLVPGHYDALADCPWTDVTWVIGECGINESVGNPAGSFEGYKKELRPIESYPQWIEKLIRGTCAAAPHLAHKIHSWMVFTYDYSSPWESKDVSGVTAPTVATAFEKWAWKGLDLSAPVTPKPPVESAGAKTTVRVNIRKGAGVTYAIVRTVDEGTLVKPVAKNAVGNWLKLDDGNWIYAMYVSGAPANLPVDGAVTPVPVPVGAARWPLDVLRITQIYGVNEANYRKYGLDGHNGTDYGCAVGTPVKAMADGTVAISANEPDGYGQVIRIWHPQLDCYSLVAHLSRRDVKVGDTVSLGQTIGLSGNTGNSTGPHLHFEIRLCNDAGVYAGGNPGMGKSTVDPVGFVEGVIRG